MGKDKTSIMKLRHDPLGKQIHDSENSHLKQRKRVGKLAKNNQNKEDEVEEVIPKEISRKILSQIREQALEAEQEDRDKKRIESEDNYRHGIQAKILSFNDFVDEIDEPITQKEEINDDDGFENLSDSEGDFDDGCEVDIDEEDEQVLNMFMGGMGTRMTLGEIIENKIREQQEISNREKEGNSQNQLAPKIIDVYTKVGQLLSTYTSGKIPRAFRILPNFQNWEDLLYLTRPDKWTPHSIRVATKLFCMGTNPRITQRFLSIVVLPRVRDNIAEYKKLNVHLYMALKKSVYRPSAFYKAILLPLSEHGDCTLLEAKIICSVVSKVSIPVLHSSVALMKLAQQSHYNGATSMFIRALCDKKYALPYPVIDQLVEHFVRFTNDTRTLPVLWHRALLVFAQRYKSDITKEQKELLKPVLRNHNHYIMTNEIRRELFSSNSRGGVVPSSNNDI